jgi:Putative serine esterase (DUF676)
MQPGCGNPVPCPAHNTPVKRPRPRTTAAALLLVGSACHSPAVLAGWEQHLGPAPNLDLPTLGGCQFWADVRWRDGWRVQRHTWTGHHRLIDTGGVRRAWGSLSLCEASLRAAAEPEPEGTHLVVLLHGLGRTRRSMAKLEAPLAAAGWRVAPLGYPSTRASVHAHAQDLADLLSGLDGVTRVSFVTHSLGGLVAREVLAESSPEWSARLTPATLIQLAPPNQGAELARRLDLLPVRLVAGPSFTQLTRRGGPAATDLDLPVTVITGAMNGNPLIRGLDDGLVAVRETHLPGAKLHVLPGALHTIVMGDPRAIELVLGALEEVR